MLRAIAMLLRRKSAPRTIHRPRLSFEPLEDRTLLSNSSPSFADQAILNALDTGTAAWLASSPQLVSEAFGVQLPIVGNWLDEMSGVAQALQASVPGFINPASGIDSARAQLQAAGFTVEQMASTPDSQGDLIRLSVNTQTNLGSLAFSVGGSTGFSYFDDGVIGQLHGVLTGAAPYATAQITFGVDTANGAPAFFVADTSTLTLGGISLSGSVGGELGIRSLSDVSAEGTAQVQFDATLGLVTTSGDHKLRVSDLASPSAVTSDINGTVGLTGMSFDAHLPFLPDLQWSGNWEATITHGNITSQENLSAPGYQTVLQGMVGSLMGSIGSFPLLGQIGQDLTQPLPLVNQSLADLIGLPTSLAIGAVVPSLTDFTQAEDALRQVGITLDITPDNAPQMIDQLIHGDRVDLIEFQQSASDTIADGNYSLPIFELPLGIVEIHADLYAKIQFDWSYSIHMGVDTTGLWFDPNSYVGVDASVEGGVSGGASLLGLIGADVSGGVGVRLHARLGLTPFDGDGRLYLPEFHHAGNSLPQDLLADFTVDLSANLYAHAQVDAHVLWWTFPVWSQDWSLGGFTSSLHQAPAAPSIPDSGGVTWWNSDGRTTQVFTVGDQLLFVNERGQSSVGYFLDGTHVMATDWNNLVGTFSADRSEITWADGTVWTSRPPLGGEWWNGGVATSIQQRGDQLALAVPPTATELSPPTSGSGPTGLTAGPDGGLWFAETSADQVARLDPATGAVTEYAVPTAAAEPTGVAFDSGGWLWFTETTGDKIGEMNTATGAVGEYPLPTPDAQPYGIALGPDGNIWFTEFNADKIGEVNTRDGAVTEYDIPTPGSQPFAIAAGPDGALWFTESAAGQIGRIDPATGAVTEYRTPTAGSQPVGIAAGPDGALWFTEMGANVVGRIDPATGSVVEYALSSPDSRPYLMTTGPDGGLWFTEQGGNRVGRIDLVTGAMTEYAVPTAASGLFGITTGPDHKVYFSEHGSGKLGRIDPKGQVATELSPPTSGSGPTGLTAGPDGGLWFAETSADQVARLDPATGAVTEYAVPTAAAEPTGVAFDSGGWLWFTETTGDKIGEMNTATGAVGEYPLPTPDAQPYGIALGPDGNIWFTEFNADKIGEVNTRDGAVTEYDIPTPGSQPFAIAAGPDGALWFTESAAGQIGRIDPATGAVTEYRTPTAGSQPVGIAAGPDGALWFTEMGANVVGRIDPATGAVAEYALPYQESRPYLMTTGPDGRMWFTEQGGNRVGRIDPTTGVVTEYTVPTAASGLFGIVAGPDGKVYFSEHGSGKLGRIDPKGADLTSTGVLLGDSTIEALNWGTTGVFIQVGSQQLIHWNNGTVWERTVITGQWGVGSQSATVSEDGNLLTFVNESGASSAGYFLDARHVVATDWGNLVGILSSDGSEIDWADGTVWKR